MLSSTSRFKLATPRRALALLSIALVAWAAGALFSTTLDPEVRFFRSALARKRAWAQRLDHEFTAKTVLCGGSSCGFSLDGERLERLHGLPTVNLGLHAGFGARFLTQAALAASRSGDTLIVALEHGILTESFQPSMGAIHLAYALGERRLLEDPADPNARIPWLGELLNLRPGGKATFALLGKGLLGQPLYRYRAEEVRPSGWQQTGVRSGIDPPMHSGKLSGDARVYLAALPEVCRKRGLHVYYSLPWAYAPEQTLARQRLLNLRLVREIATFVPVLRDPMLGAYSDLAHFADTGWHLTAPGAARRTDSFARQLATRSFWNEGTLTEAERHLKAELPPPE